MSDKLIPANPSQVSILRQLTPQISIVSAPFLRFGMFKIGSRATIVKLASGSLAVFNPTALTPEVRSHISSQGDSVKYIAAGDLEHHLFISQWADAFPSAQILGPEGLPEKRASSKDKLVKNTPFHHVYTASNKSGYKVDEEFEKEFETEFVHSHGNKELVFCHKSSRTLIEADLIFNLPAFEQYSKSGESPTTGYMTKLFNGLLHTRGEATWQRRFLWYGPASADRAAFNASMRRINSWGFDRIVPCHGEVIETGGKGVFESVMKWHLNGNKK